MRLISVVIPTYGQAKYLRQALSSVLQQSYQKVEIVVVDDNDFVSKERENVRQIVREFQKLTQLIYIELPRNSGGSTARNIGIEHAHGEYIAFLDDDDLFLPDYLECMVRELERQNFDVVYEAQWYTLVGDIALVSRKRPLKKEGNIWENVLKADIPISIFLLFKKQSIIDIGAFDINVKAYDDYDLWLKWSMNLEIGCMNEPKVIVRREIGASLTYNIKKMREGIQYIQEKWEPRLQEKEKAYLKLFVHKHIKAIEKKELQVAKKDKLRYKELYKDYVRKNRISVKEKILLQMELCETPAGNLLRLVKIYIFPRKYYMIKLK